jgi:inorganic pyrophosphatase
MRYDALATYDRAGDFRVVIESPAGSRVKLKYEPELEAFTLSRPLVLGVSYPFDWGFVPGTRAPDGDPLDAMVLLDASTYPGVVITCRPFGVVRVTQRKGRGRERNDRVIGIAAESRRFDRVRDARDLPKRIRDEIEQFFLSAVLLEGKGVKLEGWGGPNEGRKVVAAAVAAHKKVAG